MGVFDFLKIPGASVDVNEAVKSLQGKCNAWLIDVREADEYSAGHIPGSINLPVSTIETADLPFVDKDASLYVYCLSGARSRRAVRALQSLGYTNVLNIGGINAWRGPIER